MVQNVVTPEQRAVRSLTLRTDRHEFTDEQVGVLRDGLQDMFERLENAGENAADDAALSTIADIEKCHTRFSDVRAYGYYVDLFKRVQHDFDEEVANGFAGRMDGGTCRIGDRAEAVFAERDGMMETEIRLDGKTYCKSEIDMNAIGGYAPDDPAFSSVYPRCIYETVNAASDYDNRIYDAVHESVLDRASQATLDYETTELGLYMWTDYAQEQLVHYQEQAAQGPDNYQELTELTLREGAKTVPEGAFSMCRNLSSVTLPSSMQNVQYGAFGESVRDVYFTSPADTAVSYRAFPGNPAAHVNLLGADGKTITVDAKYDFTDRFHDKFRFGEAEIDALCRKESARTVDTGSVQIPGLQEQEQYE